MRTWTIALAAILAATLAADVMAACVVVVAAAPTLPPSEDEAKDRLNHSPDSSTGARNPSNRASSSPKLENMFPDDPSARPS